MKRAMIASIMMSMLLTTTSFAAGWEQMENGSWIWKDSNGIAVREEWKPASDGIDYYLGSDGIMVTNRLVEYENNMYYVDELGRKVSEKWVSIYDDESEMNRWYYFQKSGKAYAPDESGKKKEINGEKYFFDDEGRMLYGWITEDGSMIDMEDNPEGWKTAVYYAGDQNEGNIKTGWRKIDVTYDDENVRSQWFFFGNSGKKLVNNDNFKQTNADGKEYVYKFNSYGVMTSQKLLNPPAKSTSKTTKTNQTTDKSKWVERIPTMSENEYFHENEIKQKFYTNKKGTKVKDKIEKIDNKYYLFDSAGIMRTGIVAIKDDKYAYTLQNVTSWDETWADVSDMRKAMDDGYQIMYFSEEDGAREKGKIKLELMDDEYTLCFDSDGCAVDGNYKGYLYNAGVLMEAYDEDETYTINGKTYVVNKKGKILSEE